MRRRRRSISRRLRAVADANRAWGSGDRASALRRDRRLAGAATSRSARQAIDELAEVVLTGKGEPRKASGRAAPRRAGL